jgi:hypothetical protein
MFIDQNPSYYSAPFGGAEILLSVKDNLISAPPNGAQVSFGLFSINMSPLAG